MRTARLYLQDPGGARPAGVQVLIAEAPAQRMAGLLGRTRMEDDEALLLTPCAAVHTFGMRMAIDIVFLDRRQRVLAVHAAVRRARIRAHWRARETLELGAGRAAALGIVRGATLLLQEDAR